jgi:hypothetical protein
VLLRPKFGRYVTEPESRAYVAPRDDRPEPTAHWRARAARKRWFPAIGNCAIWSIRCSRREEMDNYGEGDGGRYGEGKATGVADDRGRGISCQVTDTCSDACPNFASGVLSTVQIERISLPGI